jgi:hypothetical protein
MRRPATHAAGIITSASPDGRATICPADGTRIVASVEGGRVVIRCTFGSSYGGTQHVWRISDTMARDWAERIVRSAAVRPGRQT